MISVIRLLEVFRLHLRLLRFCFQYIIVEAFDAWSFDFPATSPVGQSLCVVPISVSWPARLPRDDIAPEYPVTDRMKTLKLIGDLPINVRGCLSSSMHYIYLLQSFKLLIVY